MLKEESGTIVSRNTGQGIGQSNGQNFEKSRHGSPIDLGQAYPDLIGQPLVINGRQSCADRPDRHRQHGFHFHADNCIGCHACESACAEKNGLPTHLAFRKVGYLEGGSYPDVIRINISMACNHCENPVCLKGCPTLAYTKFIEYGAVLQDPEICFGCGYCTWVCPYNAPQLDPVRGEVQKCNMCVDRLEGGLKPACVSACLSNALEFGVIESIPSGRRQAEVTLPGFPDPAISRPNIRFEQSRSLPAQLTRADGSPLRYEREAPGGNGLEDGTTPRRFEVKPLDPGGPKGWGIGQLRSREDSLVLFTLLSQWVVGAFLLLFLIPKWGGSAGEILTAHPLVLRWTLIGLFGLQTFGMVSSTMHLGKPKFFYRALNNLRHSWVSREIAAMGTFYNLLGAAALITPFPILTAWLPETFSTLLPELIGGGGAAMGLIGLYCMARCYRIPARPFWDHWHTGAAFSASGLILGSLSLGLIFGAAEFSEGRAVTPLFRLLAVPFLVGLVLQAAALIAHARDLKRRGEEGAVSWKLMTTRFGKSHLARFVSLGLLAASGLLFAGAIPEGGSALAIWGGMSIVALLHELIGRALFYVLVVPTTHPGAFFWGNKSFEAHARKSGLAALPQVGVASDGH